MATQPVMPPSEPAPPAARARLWLPKQVLVTPDALEWEHGRGIVARAEALGLTVTRLPSSRLTLGLPDDSRQAYALAKNTLAVVVAPPSKRRLQPIAPSADWRVDLAEGCPAHCGYCYLAGSLKGPPITRVYANLPEILAELPCAVGQGKVTSRSVHRQGEGTTYEASCYTDPLGIEHLTGSLSALVAYFGRWDADVGLRFTTKFAAVQPLLGIDHNRRTRMRLSVNMRSLLRFEGGTASLDQRLGAMRAVALAGYPVGLTVAPIQPLGDWRAGYAALFADVARAVDGVADLDLTVELITHRFTEGSKATLEGWYPGSSLDMDRDARTQKRTKFGAVKHVYPADSMREMKAWFFHAVEDALPGARVLYWT